MALSAMSSAILAASSESERAGSFPSLTLLSSSFQVAERILRALGHKIDQSAEIVLVGLAKGAKVLVPILAPEDDGRVARSDG
jgi:hypothetical protein